MTARIAAASALVVCLLVCGVGTHGRAREPFPRPARSRARPHACGIVRLDARPSELRAGDRGRRHPRHPRPDRHPAAAAALVVSGGGWRCRPVAVGGAAVLAAQRDSSRRRTSGRCARWSSSGRRRGAIRERSRSRSPRSSARYVEEAFPVRAAHRTTEELLVDLMRRHEPRRRAPHRARRRSCATATWPSSQAGRCPTADMTAMLASAESVRSSPRRRLPRRAAPARAAVCSEGVA